MLTASLLAGEFPASMFRQRVLSSKDRKQKHRQGTYTFHEIAYDPPFNAMLRRLHCYLISRLVPRSRLHAAQQPGSNSFLTTLQLCPHCQWRPYHGTAACNTSTGCQGQNNPCAAFVRIHTCKGGHTHMSHTDMSIM